MLGDDGFQGPALGQRTHDDDDDIYIYMIMALGREVIEYNQIGSR